VCFWVLVTGVTNLVGSACPACCNKNSSGLLSMAITSGVSLAVRIVITVVLVTLLTNFNRNLDSYYKCVDEGNYTRQHCSNHNIRGHGRKSYRKLISYTEFCLIVTCITMVLSLLGVGFGISGHTSEVSSPATNNSNSGNTHQVVVIAVPVDVGAPVTVVDDDEETGDKEEGSTPASSSQTISVQPF
jgi:hypothetical protein